MEVRILLYKHLLYARDTLDPIEKNIRQKFWKFRPD